MMRKADTILDEIHATRHKIEARTKGMTDLTHFTPYNYR